MERKKLLFLFNILIHRTSKIFLRLEIQCEYKKNLCFMHIFPKTDIKISSTPTVITIGQKWSLSEVLVPRLGKGIWKSCRDIFFLSCRDICKRYIEAVLVKNFTVGWDEQRIMYKVTLIHCIIFRRWMMWFKEFYLSLIQ